MKEESIFLRIWRIIYPMLIYLGISYVVSMASMVFIIVRGVLSGGMEMSNVYTMNELLINEVYQYALLMTLITGVITTPVLYLFYRSDKKKQEYFETFSKPSILSYVYIVILAAVSTFGVNNLIDLSNIIEVFPGFKEVAQSIYGGNIIIEVLTVVIMAPIVEELMFRGLVYKRLRRDIKPIYAILISALLFGVYHMNVVQGLYAFVIGALMAYVYEKYKTLVAPILFHAVANGISVILTETTILDFLYSSGFMILFTTAVEIIILVLMVFVIHKKINRNRNLENQTT